MKAARRSLKIFEGKSLKLKGLLCLKMASSPSRLTKKDFKYKLIHYASLIIATNKKLISEIHYCLHHLKTQVLRNIPVWINLAETGIRMFLPRRQCLKYNNNVWIEAILSSWEITAMKLWGLWWRSLPRRHNNVMTSKH